MSARIQVVVPCYNEAARLTTDAFVELVSTRCDVAVLFVDDGSTDATAAALAGVASRAPERISIIRMPRNVGKARAVQLGVLAAFERQPMYVGYWDADLSTPLSTLGALVEVLDANPVVDIVMGSRVRLLGRHIVRSPVRHYGGRVFATAASLALNLPVYDTQCGAKLFRANERLTRTFEQPFRSKWLVDVEMLARYVAVAGRDAAERGIYELPLDSWIEIPGSKLRFTSALIAAAELAAIWRRSRR